MDEVLPKIILNLTSIITVITAIIGWFAVAYESALQEFSLSKLVDILEEDEFQANDKNNVETKAPTPNVFLRKIIKNKSHFRLSLSVASSFFLGLFIIISLPIWKDLTYISYTPETQNRIFMQVLPYVNSALPVIIVLLITAILRMSAQALGEKNSENIVYKMVIPAWIVTIFFIPAASIFSYVFIIFARGIGYNIKVTQDELEDDVIAAVTDGEIAGVMNEEQREMIERVFDFNDTDIADIFTPRTDMISISITEPLSNAIKISLNSGHSRLPVHEETRDNVIGIFYVRDALTYWEFEDKPRLNDIIHRPTFVPETQKVVDLLQIMQSSHTQIAIVLDEYGGTAGLVTIEDILEELVGEIQDEYDHLENDNDVIAHSKDHVIADGQTHVSDINKALDEDIIPDDDDYETIGGFVLANLGHIPLAGEEFNYKFLKVKVLDADERRVLKVEVMRERTDK